jgi:hypothetical protein
MKKTNDSILAGLHYCYSTGMGSGFIVTGGSRAYLLFK